MKRTFFTYGTRALLLIVESVALAACAGSVHPAEAPTSPTVVPVAPAAPAIQPTASVAVPPPSALPSSRPSASDAIPDSPAGHQFAWILASIHHPPTELDVTLHFTPMFLSHASAAQVVAIFGQLGTGGAFTVTQVTTPSPSELTTILEPEHGPKVRVRLRVDTKGWIAGLLFQPVVDPKPVASWDEVTSRLAAVAPTVGYLAAEIDGNTCTPIASHESTRPLALGSTFKLYVLEALAADVAAGKRGWDDSLAIEEAHRSLPSGPMMGEPTGATFSLRHYAEQMISVSDNTAADHLLALLGRPAVENAVRASGHAKPSLLTPFLSTRDLFALKLLASDSERAAYVAADVAKRRALLPTYERRDLKSLLTRPPFTQPMMIDSIEWLASPMDLCKIMAALHARAAAPATAAVGSILSINPGLADEKQQYRYVGFKGGSEPGVMNFTWLLQRARDGKWLFFTVGLNNATAPVDTWEAIGAVGAARELLGR